MVSGDTITMLRDVVVTPLLRIGGTLLEVECQTSRTLAAGSRWVVVDGRAGWDRDVLVDLDCGGLVAFVRRQDAVSDWVWESLPGRCTCPVCVLFATRAGKIVDLEG